MILCQTGWEMFQRRHKVDCSHFPRRLLPMFTEKCIVMSQKGNKKKKLTDNEKQSKRPYRRYEGTGEPDAYLTAGQSRISKAEVAEIDSWTK